MIKGLSLIYTEEDIQKAYKQGIENGKYEAKSEFEVYKIAFNSTVEGYKKCISELKEEKKELLRKEFNKGFEKGSDYVRDFIKQEKEIQNNREEEIQKLAFNDEYQAGKKEGYEGGYTQAYSELHAPTTERERQLQEKAWDEGYKEGESDMLETMNELSRHQAEDWNACREHHNPNKKTQEAVQEVLDKGLNGAVNSPKHYNSDPSGVQCIEITRHRNNNIGNVIKYLWRNGLKDGNSNIQDLEKGAWYLNDEIQRLKGLQHD